MLGKHAFHLWGGSDIPNPLAATETELSLRFESYRPVGLKRLYVLLLFYKF